LVEALDPDEGIATVHLELHGGASFHEFGEDVAEVCNRGVAFSARCEVVHRHATLGCLQVQDEGPTTITLESHEPTDELHLPLAFVFHAEVAVLPLFFFVIDAR
jgi:hypothetical protein